MFLYILIFLIANLNINNLFKNSQNEKYSYKYVLKEPEVKVDTIFMKDIKPHFNSSFKNFKNQLEKLNFTKFDYKEKINPYLKGSQQGRFEHLNKHLRTKIFSNVQVVVEACVRKASEPDSTEKWILIEEWHFKTQKDAELAIRYLNKVSDNTVPTIFLKHWLWKQNAERVYFIESFTHPVEHPNVQEIWSLIPE